MIEAESAGAGGGPKLDFEAIQGAAFPLRIDGGMSGKLLVIQIPNVRRFFSGSGSGWVKQGFGGPRGFVGAESGFGPGRENGLGISGGIVKRDGGRLPSGGESFIPERLPGKASDRQWDDGMVPAVIDDRRPDLRQRDGQVPVTTGLRERFRPPDGVGAMDRVGQVELGDGLLVEVVEAKANVFLASGESVGGAAGDNERGVGWGERRQLNGIVTPAGVSIMADGAEVAEECAAVGIDQLEMGPPIEVEIAAAVGVLAGDPEGECVAGSFEVKARLAPGLAVGVGRKRHPRAAESSRFVMMLAAVADGVEGEHGAIGQGCFEPERVEAKAVHEEGEEQSGQGQHGGYRDKDAAVKSLALTAGFGFGHVVADPGFIEGRLVNAVSHLEETGVSGDKAGEFEDGNEGIAFVVRNAAAAADRLVLGQERGDVAIAAQEALADEDQIVIPFPGSGERNSWEQTWSTMVGEGSSGGVGFAGAGGVSWRS